MMAAMRSRFAAICFLLCASLLVTQTVGVHLHAELAHSSHSGDTAAHEPGHDHDEGRVLVLDRMNEHVTHHLNGIAVDMEQDGALSAAKVFFSSLLLGLAAAIVVFNLQRVVFVHRFSWQRIPVPRRHYRVTPPSQGPPAAFASV